MLSMTNVETAHEMMVVGGMMSNPERCIDFAIASLEKDSFFDPDVAELFSIIVERFRGKHSTEPASLLVDLRSRAGNQAAGLLGDIVGHAMGFDYWNFPYYVGRVQDDDQIRQFAQLQSSLAEDIEACSRGSESPSSLIQSVGQKLASIGERRSVEIASVYESGLEFLEDNDKRDDSQGGVEFGIPVVDRKLGGLQGGELIVPAARPGQGKSVISLQACRNVCSSGGAALYVSLEMSRKELTNRLIAGLSAIDIGAVRTRKMDSSETKLYATALSQMEAWDFFICDRPGLTLDEIRQAAKAQKVRTGLDLLVVDYIRLIRPTNKRLERRDQIAESTQGLKELAKELNIPVIAVCQMNRETDRVEVPKLSNLADSSAVEQDADIVFFLHRPNADATETSLVIAKHRHGMQSTEAVELNTATMMFEQASEWEP